MFDKNGIKICSVNSTNYNIYKIWSFKNFAFNNTILLSELKNFKDIFNKCKGL